MSKVRKIAPINSRGIIPATIDTAPPTFEWADPASLFVEEDYQRDVAERSIAMVRKIVARWNWAHIKPAVCVRDRGRLVVVDGQHTAIAAVTHGGIKKIPIMVVDAPTVRRRATAFVSQNRDRVGITVQQMHFAALAAGDVESVAADQACKKAGVIVLRTSRGTRGVYRVGETFAIGLITRLVAKIGVHHMAKVLKVLVDAKRAPISAHEIRAVWQLLYDARWKDKIDPFDLATLVRSKPMDRWRAEAWKLVADGVPRRDACAACWAKAVLRKAA